MDFPVPHSVHNSGIYFQYLVNIPDYFVSPLFVQGFKIQDQQVICNTLLAVLRISHMNNAALHSGLELADPADTTSPLSAAAVSTRLDAKADQADLDTLESTVSKKADTGDIPVVLDRTTSDSTTSALSANQGRVLNNRIDAIEKTGVQATNVARTIWNRATVDTTPSAAVISPATFEVPTGTNSWLQIVNVPEILLPTDLKAYFYGMLSYLGTEITDDDELIRFRAGASEVILTAADLADLAVGGFNEEFTIERATGNYEMINFDIHVKIPATDEVIEIDYLGILTRSA